MKQVLIDNICYSLDPTTRTATICLREDDEKYVGDIVIPATITYDGTSYRVANIGKKAFYLCAELNSVVIPDSVVAIGSFAFHKCSNMPTIIIPDSVTSIGEHTFGDCVKLASMTLSDNVNSIGDFAFGGCSSLTSITIPSKLTTIGCRAFAGSCVTSITIPNSVTSIEEFAFLECKNLTSIFIPSSVTDIGERAFDSCVSLESIVVEPSNPVYDSRNNCNAIIETATNTLIAGCKNTIIPDGVTSIGVGAFSYCKNLVSITIPSSVTSIGFWAFGWCDKLASITIPDSVTTVGDCAFLMNPWLDNLPAGPIYINTVLYGYKGEMPQNTQITVRQGTLRISSSAFSQCKNLISVTIPNSVTSIGHDAFEDCNLESIVVEPGNPVYDSRNNCNAIIETETNTLIVGCKNTIIPNGVTCIGDLAFWGCKDLASIDIPNSVTSIEYDAFFGCAGLTSIVIPNSVTSIGKNAFCSCKSLASLTIPNSVISIGESAFDGSGLTSIIIPDGVTSIGEGAFGGCNNLRQITVAPGNPTYDSRNNCNAIIEAATNTLIAGCQNTIIPDGVTSIGASAFSDCENLTSIAIPNSVISIGECAFYGSGLTSIIIPDGVTSIGESVFDDCESLMSITLPASIEEIGKAMLGWHYYNQHTICYVPQGMTEKFCKMGLKRWRKQIVEISLQDEKESK